MDRIRVIDAVAEALVTAGSTYSPEKMRAYERALAVETNERARWALEQIIDNGRAATEARSPLCDDTGIPHLFLEVGREHAVSDDLIRFIIEGVAEGLRRLPGRPMAVCGEGDVRLAQAEGMYEDPSMLEPAPMAVRVVDEDVLRLSVLMLGGGPAIRGRSFRVFHRHSARVVKEQIVEWAVEATSQLGCTPCTLAVGIGRSHYEAANLMLEAQVYGNYDVQSDFERQITEAVNTQGVGALGLGGHTTALATFAKIGPARASGVRIVCFRPCCCFEPRIAKVDLAEVMGIG
ncbi:fumarate hydratase [Adlercreutzia sp. ZJ473]|uniref:fumarate hydratase n=1 Tax=Adlercreutzia sp. ZJ473 TaxID=2722822 RepID=UPI00155393D0|nr:fumarate hydratase [Adlercreutzia sp. ZJ473]